jgi:hypothetical protein
MAQIALVYIKFNEESKIRLKRMKAERCIEQSRGRWINIRSVLNLLSSLSER